ncbi:lasso peptide biosynthesis B2 protein [Actinopolyspora mortivallis]|uniref:lasso peptide biosynthesis B2 protein n=1 Tax=Actinopolyspora mortivallis TaxID=33906 RepID=UPI000399D453|nr:lasso peptide biosynthesis B2 protein [Actinopolyspora mortivallis]
MASPQTAIRPGHARTLAAALVVTVVRAAVTTLPFGWVTALIRHVNGGRQATRGEAERALHAVDAAAVWLPFRIACLERSLAGLILLAGRRHRVTWCLGVRQTPPIAMHAWLADTAGVPIAESDTMPTYRTILTVPSAQTGEITQ